MFYVVADEFLRAHGKESSVHAGFKWRSRREVVDWLTSMLSKQHSSGDHSGLACFSFLIFYFISIVGFMVNSRCVRPNLLKLTPFFNLSTFVRAFAYKIL